LRTDDRDTKVVRYRECERPPLAVCLAVAERYARRLIDRATLEAMAEWAKSKPPTRH
jgi:hypothetical protein